MDIDGCCLVEYDTGSSITAFELAHHPPTSKIAPVGPVRILIDGFGALHACREELPQTAPHTAKAQDWLAHKCLKYQDAMGQPITLFFDGKGTGGKPSRVESNPHLEILYSQGNQTADHMIERVTHRLLPYGPVVVVTNDHAERGNHSLHGWRGPILRSVHGGDASMLRGGFPRSCPLSET